MNFLRALLAGLLTTTVSAKAADSTPSQKSSAEMMKSLRQQWLVTPPKEGTFKDKNEVVAVLMDWPVGENTITVLSSSIGDASLYTTSSFGIIGGIGHAKVREAAIAFVKGSQIYADKAQPVSEFPYPDKNSLQFYFITPSGVKRLSFPLTEIERENSDARILYTLGQQVITELRLISPNP